MHHSNITLLNVCVMQTVQYMYNALTILTSGLINVSQKKKTSRHHLPILLTLSSLVSLLKGNTPDQMER